MMSNDDHKTAAFEISARSTKDEMINFKILLTMNWDNISLGNKFNGQFDHS